MRYIYVGHEGCLKIDLVGSVKIGPFVPVAPRYARARKMRSLLRIPNRRRFATPASEWVRTRMIDLRGVAYVSPLITHLPFPGKMINFAVRGVRRTCAGAAKMLSISDSWVVFTAEKRSARLARWSLEEEGRGQRRYARGRRERKGGLARGKISKMPQPGGIICQVTRGSPQSTCARIQNTAWRSFEFLVTRDFAARVWAIEQAWEARELRWRKNNRRNLIMSSRFSDAAPRHAWQYLMIAKLGH